MSTTRSSNGPGSQTEEILSDNRRRWAQGQQAPDERDRLAQMYLQGATLRAIERSDEHHTRAIAELTEAITQLTMRLEFHTPDPLPARNPGPVERNIQALSGLLSRNWKLILGAAALSGGGASAEHVIRLLGGA